MLTLTLFSIVTRWVSYTTLWVDPLIRHMVFLSAFLGGVLATGGRQHIGIDILSKYLERFENELLIHIQQIFLNLVSFIVLLWAVYASTQLVKDAFQYEGIVFLGIHSGYLVSIIPLGLSLMAFRFFFLAIADMRRS